MNNQVTQETAEKLVGLLNRTGASKPVEIAKKPVLHFRNSQIAAGLAGTVGLVVFALGVENLISTIPNLQSPMVEIAIGLFLLVISGLFLKKMN